jgi:hypothetical protein
MVLFGVLAASAMVLVACDDEPTQDEANEQFCDDTSEFIASLRVIRDLDSDSTFEEVEAARERARDAYATMVESSAGVVDARLDDLQASYDELLSAVDEIDSDTAIGDALESVDDEIEQVALEASQVFNDVDCGTSDSDSQSDE